MKNTSDYWIVTDLDGTLMDENYDISPAYKTLERLKQISVPVIPCTSKTAAEVRYFRYKYHMSDPYIVENGGAIYGNQQDSEWEIVLGRSYNELREILKKLSIEVGYPFKPLNDLSEKDVIELTNLSSEGVKKAFDRHWSVPFLNPPDHYLKKLLNLIKKYQVKVFKGNRMSHLLSINSDKGKAVNTLKSFLDCNNTKIIALGDSPNDMPLLEIADHAIVVPGKDGPNPFFDEAILNRKFTLAPAPNALGWSMAIESILG